MAKAPRPRKPEGEGKNHIIIKVDGKEYGLRFDEIPASEAGVLRKATGASLKSVFEDAGNDPDIDTVAALVWLSRRQNGEKNLPYNVVADAINYLTDIEEVEGEPAEDESDPQP